MLFAAMKVAFCMFIVAAAASPHLPVQTTTTYNHITQVELRARATTTGAISSQKFPLGTEQCGWINGVETSSLECPERSTCIIAPNKTINAGGCCGSLGCGTFRTTCINSRDTCNSACLDNKANLYCSQESAPLCATYTYPGGYSDLRCVKTPERNLQVAFTYSRYSTPVPLPRLAVALQICPSSVTTCKATIDVQTQPVVSATSTPKPPSSSSLSSEETSTEVTPTQSAGPTSSSKNQTGAIVGGVVGGIGGTAVIAGVIFFYFLWRKRKVRSAEQNRITSTSIDIPPDTSLGFKAELPGAPSIVPPKDPAKKATLYTPERYEMGGVRQQYSPIVEMDAGETQTYRT